MPPSPKKRRTTRTPVSGPKVKGGTRTISTHKKKKKKSENPLGYKIFIPHSDYLEQRKKCLAYIKQVGLSVPRVPYDPFKSHHVSIAPTTQAAYKRCWNDMATFFYMIGDFQSAMLVDRKICPTNPLPMVPQSFALYMTYRCAQAGLPLIHPGTGTQVKNYKGEKMTTLGGWNSPSHFAKVHSATLFLHESA